MLLQIDRKLRRHMEVAAAKTIEKACCASQGERSKVVAHKVG
jgi:hypothetical protein